MKKPSVSVKIRFLIVALFCCSLTSLSQEQTKTPNPNGAVEKPKDEVVRINTDLVQTGIAVFDKKGQFVNNLKREDFELRVDGKPVPISFFEQVAPKSTVKSTGDKPKTEQKGEKTNETNLPPATAVRRSRTVLFIVDDSHLSFENLKLTKNSILKFIEREMTPDDSAAIVSTNAKLGFLQQFTNDKTILRAAVEKLIYTRDNTGITRFDPHMNEYQAALIDRRDQDMTDIFAGLLAFQNPDLEMESLREMARTQARTVLLQSAVVSRNVYSSLEKAIRSTSRQPGRKIVFLLSEGFLLNIENTDSANQLNLITDAAVRANAVIYSLDAKGLDAALPENFNSVNTGVYIGDEVAGSAGTKGTGQPRNYAATLLRAQAGARFESLDGLNLLAKNTGGRLITNTNDFQTAMTKALEEASAYYLLAWQPDADSSDKSDKLRRIEVSVKNRPDLQVLAQNGFLNGNLKATSGVNATNAGENSKTTIELPKTAKAPVSIAEEQLNNAIGAQTPARDLPTALAVNYLDLPNDGATMAAVLQIKSDAIEFAPKNDEATAKIDLLGVIFDSKGNRQASFRKLLTVNVSPDQLDERADLYYNYQTKLKPGLYQLRVAARDVKSGRVGSDLQWIEIPDLSSRKLALSSLLLSEQAEDAGGPRQVLSDSPSALAETEVSVERRFNRSSQLRYLIFIYNAARGQNGQLPPDVTIQTQILRGNQALMTTPARSVAVEGQDAARLPFAGEIPLDSLSPGRYELQVMVNDRMAKTSASQRLSFEIK